MKGLAFRISAIAFMMVFIPTIIFSVYEFSTLKTNEEVVKDIYNNQLEAILFSLNQYSEDITSSMVKEATAAFSNYLDENELNSFIQKYPFIKGVVIIDSLEANQAFYTYEQRFDEIPESINETVNVHKAKINKLFEFYAVNYQKLEPFVIDEAGNTLLTFAVSGTERKQLMGFYIKAEDFVHQVLRSKIFQVAQEKFVITLLNTNDQVIFSTLESNEDIDAAYSSYLWLLPGYKFQIQLVGETIESLVKNRSRINLIIIVILDLTLLMGALLMFLILRKETKLNQLKSEFVSNVSHEIRTPLALIKMYIETLSMGRVKSEEKKEEYYKIIFQETNRLSSIVNKILSFSKIDNGKQKLKITESDLNSIVSNMLESYDYKLKNENITVSFSAGENMPLIRVDEELILNVFINLLDNAIKYSGPDKKITIETGLKGSKQYFSMTDNGFGISSENLKHIFDKFYRVTEGNLAHKAKGSGIGLSIVKNIIESHGGEIKVSSKLNEGTTFTILLPQTSFENKN